MGKTPGLDQKPKAKESDQSKFSTGIRDLIDVEVDAEDGKFSEIESLPSYRRDPEESRYDEAGQPVTTQGDYEMDEIRNE